MYERIRIQNFRGIEDLTIADLGRVNLIVGANNVGKTSVLEALALLHLGNDPLEFVQLVTRRSSWPYGVPVRMLYGLVRNEDWSAGIEVTGQKSTNGDVEQGASANTVLVRGSVSAQYPLPTNLRQRRQMSLSVEGLTFDGVELFYCSSASQPIDPVSSQNPEWQHSTIVDPTKQFSNSLWPTSVFGESAAHWTWRRRLEEDLANDWSRLKERRRENTLNKVLQKLDARVEEVFVASQPFAHGANRMRVQQPVLRINVSGQHTAVGPALLGSGAERLIELLISSPSEGDGVVLVDEVDDGIYHESLGLLWTALGEMVREANVQLFSTTHSLECVDAAVDALSECYSDDFRLHRLERMGDEIRCVTYSLQDLQSTRQLNWEFR